MTCCYARGTVRPLRLRAYLCFLSQPFAWAPGIMPLHSLAKEEKSPNFVCFVKIEKGFKYCSVINNHCLQYVRPWVYLQPWSGRNKGCILPPLLTVNVTLGQVSYLVLCPGLMTALAMAECNGCDRCSWSMTLLESWKDPASWGRVDLTLQENQSYICAGIGDNNCWITFQSQGPM